MATGNSIPSWFDHAAAEITSLLATSSDFSRMVSFRGPEFHSDTGNFISAYPVPELRLQGRIYSTLLHNLSFLQKTPFFCHFLYLRVPAFIP